MDKKAKIITYVAIGVILLILIGIAVITKFTGGVPGLTAYSANGTTAQCIIGGYAWRNLIKDTVVDSIVPTEFNYYNENTLLVKPGEEITFRNSGRDFDEYKFYQNYIKYYDKSNNETSISTADLPANMDAKHLTITAPQEEGTYIYAINLNYHSKGEVEYGIKVVVSSTPSYKVEEIIEYKDTDVENVTLVNQLIDSLPYGENKESIAIRVADVPRELIVNYKELDADKNLFMDNSVALFALIPNLDIITYKLDEGTFVYVRDELEIIYNRDLLEYTEDVELWKKEILYNELEESESAKVEMCTYILSDAISKTNQKNIFIDLSSFGINEAFELNDSEKRNVLEKCSIKYKTLIETTAEHVLSDESFDGILLYAGNMFAEEDAIIIELNEYYSNKKLEKVAYKIMKDGTISVKNSEE